MSRSARIALLFSFCIGLLTAAPSGAQGFGAAKEKVTLQRKLPALVHMPGDTIKVTVTSSEEDGTLPYDFQALLETELLKDDPNLRDDDNPSTQIICQITEYSHPEPELHQQIGVGSSPWLVQLPTLDAFEDSPRRSGATERITGKLDVSFQAKDATGRVLISDNIDSTYDREFDSAGNSTSHGVFGQVGGSLLARQGRSQERRWPTHPMPS